MRDITLTYGFGTRLDMPYDAAVERVREALATEGFGVLTEIDVRATLKQKLDVEFRPYIILGACNPPLAHKALSTELDIGLLLPCNVIVYAADDEGSVVNVMDPVAALGLTGRDDIRPLAEDVRARMGRVVERLKTQTPSEPGEA